MNIDTARARLRPLTSADVDDLVRLDSDPQVMRFVSGGEPTPRSVIEDWVVPRAEAERRAHGTGVWTMTDRITGAFLGWIALRTPRHSARTELELSYRLRRAAWGRGLATEGGWALVSCAFTELEAERVFAGTMAVNAGSRRVMEKLGMCLTGIHVSDDHAGDGVPELSVVGFLADGGFARTEVEYELSRARWRARADRHQHIGARPVRGSRFVVGGLTA